MKVIETNISFSQSDEQFDFQSRLIEINDWDDYVKEIKETKSVIRDSVIGNLHGESFPRFFKEVKDFKSDDYHLSCSFINGAGFKMLKLAYLVDK